MNHLERIKRSVCACGLSLLLAGLAAVNVEAASSLKDYSKQGALTPGAKTLALQGDERKQLLRVRDMVKSNLDVYRKLYDKWKIPVFKRIAETQQRHFESVELLIDWYKLGDSVDIAAAGDGPDIDPDFSRYERLVEGELSRTDALFLAAELEEKDVSYMVDAMVSNHHWDILMVYESLMSGSRSNLENLVRELNFLGHVYHPRIFTENEFSTLF